MAEKTVSGMTAPKKTIGAAAGRAFGTARHSRMLSAFGIGIVGAAVTASLGIVPPTPAQAADYPTWGDVQKAKHSVAEQKKMLQRIDSVVESLQDHVDQATIASMKADNDYQGAQVKLAAARARTAALRKEASQAAKTASVSRTRAGLLASHLARTGGGDITLDLLLTGSDSTKADNLLYQLGTMSKLTQQTRVIYASAVSDRNTAHALAEQARQAQDELQKLADQARQALQGAQDAQDAAQRALGVQRTESDKLAAQLASLRNTSVATERAYLQGVARRRALQAEQQAERAARQAAAEQAERRAAQASAAAAAAREAAQAAAARRAAQQHQDGQSGAGAPGGTVPGGTAPHESPAPDVSAPRPPQGGASGVSGADPAPNATAVERAIAFAKEQLGKPYALGGAGPDTWDCSGLVMMAYRYAGVDVGAHWVPSQYDTMAARGLLVPYSQRRRGDILFWSDGAGGIYHDGIYLGGGMMIAAPTWGDVVKIQPVWGQGGDLMNVVGRPAA